MERKGLSELPSNIQKNFKEKKIAFNGGTCARHKNSIMNEIEKKSTKEYRGTLSAFPKI